jgi:hypothetical protein
MTMGVRQKDDASSLRSRWVAFACGAERKRIERAQLSALSACGHAAAPYSRLIDFVFVKWLFLSVGSLSV